MPSEYRLTPRMAQFAREYVASGNAAASVRNSGYSASGATAQGVRLLAKVSVQAEIARLKALQERSATIDRNYVLTKLRILAEDADTDSVKVRAVELLGKTLGMFVDVQETHTTHNVEALRVRISPPRPNRIPTKTRRIAGSSALTGTFLQHAPLR